MEIKTLTPEEVKRDYSTKVGFVFLGASPSSDRAIEHLCNVLIQHGITTSQPDVVVRLSDNNFAVIYKDSFSGPEFFQKATIATRMGICNIYSLHEFNLI